MISRNIQPTSSLVVERGAGHWVYDRDGRRYMDLTSGIGVLNLGHGYPTVVKAIQTQAEQLIHCQFTTAFSTPLLDFCSKVQRVLPRGLNQIFPTNSGSEAIDASIRMARQITGRPNVIAFDGAFHGRTIAAASVGGYTTKIKKGIQPLMAGVYHAPFPNLEMIDEQEAFQHLQRLLKTQSHPDDTAAILIEPIQGENGYRYAGSTFLKHLRRLCDAIGALLIVDEVQTGYGRTGTFWAHERASIVPDMIVAGKAAGGGLPFGFVASKYDDTCKLTPGSLGGTFGGNPVVCAAACAVLDAFLDDPDLLPAVAAAEERLLDRLRAMVYINDRRNIDDVRCYGYAMAIDFVKPGGMGVPQPDLVTQILKRCEDAGIIILRGGFESSTLRILPPLTMPEETVLNALDAIDHHIQEVLNAE